MNAVANWRWWVAVIPVLVIASIGLSIAFIAYLLEHVGKLLGWIVDGITSTVRKMSEWAWQR